MKFLQKFSGLALAAGVVAGCAGPSENLSLVEGPPIADIVTPFDDALVCLNDKVTKQLTFAVGGIPDATGREQHNNDGAGKFVTQGAGDMVQSALFKTGVTLLNRRDMGSAALEAQWGIRSMQTQRPANLVITGSINSLDFIPAGGSFAGVDGVGPRYRQNRILVGIDMAMTNANNGAIVANISLRKQIFADEMGLMAARFNDDVYIDIDFGGSRREAIHFALRQMLQLATFELLTQLMPPEDYAECRDLIDERYGEITGDRTTGEQIREMEAEAAEAAAEQKAIEDDQNSGVTDASRSAGLELESDEPGNNVSDNAELADRSTNLNSTNSSTPAAGEDVDPGPTPVPTAAGATSDDLRSVRNSEVPTSMDRETDEMVAEVDSREIQNESSQDQSSENSSSLSSRPEATVAPAQMESDFLRRSLQESRPFYRMPNELASTLAMVER